MPGRELRDELEGGEIRVLHVDDDEPFRELAAEFLEREGERISVLTEPGAADAVDRLDTDRVDCVVSDYEMPDADGIELLRTVREDRPELPFILLTGKGSEAVASDAISAGATDYVRKKRGTDQFTVLANRIENVVERARADRQQSRQLDAIESAREGIGILNDDGRFVYVNDAYAELYGYEPGELVGTHWERLYPDGETAQAHEEILPTVEREGHWHGRTTGLRADGTTFPEDHVVSATDSGELICTVRDLTDREAWRERITRFRTLVETIDDPVYVLDETGAFEYVNEAFLEMVGYERERVLGSGPELIKDEPAVSRAESNLGRVLSSDGPDSVRFELEIQPREGEPVTCEDHMAVLPFEGETFDGSVGILRDVSERNAHERELERQNERLDEFTSIVSHDLRSPLSVAEGRLELAAIDCDSPHIGDARDAIERSQALIDDLLTLAREGSSVGEVEPVELAAVAESSWESVETPDASLSVATDLTVRADPSRLRQLFENLFRNSVEHGSTDPPSHAREDAVEHGSTSSRPPADDAVEHGSTDPPSHARDDAVEHGSTSSQPPADDAGTARGSEQSVADAPDDGVTVTVGTLEDGFYVADDGPGIPTGERGHVFEPGYTTGEDGTGFGLSIVERVAEAHDWEVGVTESDDGGARFEVTGVDPPA